MGRVGTRKLTRSMTVRQLREALDGLDDEMLVAFACDYGDRAHTQQVLSITTADEYDESEIEESGYSNSGFALLEGDEEDEAPEPIGKNILILS